MFINKGPDGRNNICGVRIAQLRSEKGISQRMLADQLQLLGLDLDKNAIQRIEAGKRFITDIELLVFCPVFCGLRSGALRLIIRRRTKRNRPSGRFLFAG